MTKADRTTHHCPAVSKDLLPGVESVALALSRGARTTGACLSPNGLTCPWQDLHLYTYMYTNKKCRSISETSENMCIFIFFSRPGKTAAFLTLSWDRRGDKHWRVELYRDLTWDILCGQVWHQWPRTKVCPFSWDLLSWALTPGCHRPMGYPVSQIIHSLTLHWLSLRQVRS